MYLVTYAQLPVMLETFLFKPGTNADIQQPENTGN